MKHQGSEAIEQRLRERGVVLEMVGVSVPERAQASAELRHIHLRLKPGELALVRLEPGNEHVPLGDAAEGLVAPSEGNVYFIGDDWRTLPTESELRLRARIGRVFDGHGWVSNLTVLENVVLAQRHHTRRPIEAIRAEADTLARAVGLPAVPTARPALVKRRDLRRAEWVRALMGAPVLLILERPTLGVALDDVPPLIAAVAAARARGAAALWLTTEDTVWCNAALNPTQRFVMQGPRMTPPAEPG